MKKLLAVIAILMLTTSAFGNERGNGGNAVVCREQDGSIRSAELLDVYEGRALFGLKYFSLEGSIDEKFDSILKDIYGRDLSETENMMFHHFKKSFTMLPSGVGLEPINDSLQIIIPRNCKIEQVANFYNVQKIFIVTDIYNKLNDLNKLGLLLHEVFYYLERQGGITNSLYTRRVVAHLLSSNFKADAILSGVDLETDYFCTTTQLQNMPSGYTNPKVTSFWAVKSEENNWRFQFVRLNGHIIFSKKYADFSFEDGTFPLDPNEETTLQGTVYSTSSLESKIDGLEGLSLTRSNGVVETPFGNMFMSIRWNGFDPDDNIVGNHFTCKKSNNF